MTCDHISKLHKCGAKHPKIYYIGVISANLACVTSDTYCTIWSVMYDNSQKLHSTTRSVTCDCAPLPVHTVCPTSVSKAPQTIWKYNALLHLISEHSTGLTPPKIPRQLLSHMHITKEEEKALGIKEEVAVTWREEHNILGIET